MLNKNCILTNENKISFIKTNELLVANDIWGYDNIGYSFDEYGEHNWGSLSPKAITISEDPYTMYVYQITQHEDSLFFEFSPDMELPGGDYSIYFIVKKGDQNLGVKLDFGAGAWDIERRGMKDLLSYDDIGKTFDVYISDKPPTFVWVQHTYF